MTIPGTFLIALLALLALPGAVMAKDKPVEYFASAKAKYEKGDLEGAIADLDRAIAINPKYGDAYTWRGAAKGARGDVEGAIADFERAIAINPKDDAAYYNHGFAKQSKGDMVGAIADYDRAVAINPKYDKAYNNRGDAYALKRKWQEALTDYRHVCELNEKRQDYPHLFIWLMRARIGETEAAGKELSAFLEKRSNAASNDWVSTLGGHLLGTVTEEKLLTAAASPDAKKERGQKCEAWFYAGMKKLVAGDKAAAADSFRKSIATEQKDFTEYQLAGAELKALAP